jgi:hypothetical protein
MGLREFEAPYYATTVISDWHISPEHTEAGRYEVKKWDSDRTNAVERGLVEYERYARLPEFLRTAVACSLSNPDAKGYEDDYDDDDDEQVEMPERANWIWLELRAKALRLIGRVVRALAGQMQIHRPARQDIRIQGNYIRFAGPWGMNLEGVEGAMVTNNWLESADAVNNRLGIELPC